MTNELNLNSFLNDIKFILDNHKEELKRTGEGFNVFEVIKKQHKELVHSSMIAELLNPNGCHYQGSIFFKYFIDIILPEKTDFDLESIRAQTEAGEDIDGRIDILIWDKNSNRIVIENKIWAYDQPQQIDRYAKSFPKDKTHILYLTPDGHAPSKESMSKTPKNFKCISYKEDILKWICKCVKYLDESCIRGMYETLNQYRTTILNITNMRTNELNKKIAEEILKNGENYESFRSIVPIENLVYRKLTEDFYEKMKSISDSIQLELSPIDELIKEELPVVSMTRSNLKSRNISLRLQFQNENYSCPYIGIGYIVESNAVSEFDSTLSENFKSEFGNEYAVEKGSSWWIAGMYLRNKQDWGYDLFAKIKFGDETYISEITNIFKRTLKVIEKSII